MDLDMHYYGTYTLARAAGVRRDAATIIATAAEYVDDSTDTGIVENATGARFVQETTAHHPTSFEPNNDDDDQRHVRVPFHFLPGGEGNSLTDKLICLKDSAIAREMVTHHLDLADLDISLELIGVTAHVYADTFAHYGFSGVSSRRNRVIASSLQTTETDPLTARLFGGIRDSFFAKYGTQGGLLDNIKKELREITSTAAEDLTGALGHGAVATYPDQPYLHWAYEYEFSDLRSGADKVERQNPKDYLEGCRALHGMFSTFVSRRPEFLDQKSKRDFDAIAPVVTQIIGVPGDRDARIAAWQAKVASGVLTGDSQERIIPYENTRWHAEFGKLASLSDPALALVVPVHRFQRAAALHRHYVLRELLPKNEIALI